MKAVFVTLIINYDDIYKLNISIIPRCYASVYLIL